MYVVKNSVERLLYALGVGWQGRVSCELQNTITLSLRWHPLFLPRHNGAPILCGASSDEIHTFFDGLAQTALWYNDVCGYVILRHEQQTDHWCMSC